MDLKKLNMGSWKYFFLLPLMGCLTFQSYGQVVVTPVVNPVPVVTVNVNPVVNPVVTSNVHPVVNPGVVTANVHPVVDPVVVTANIHPVVTPVVVNANAGWRNFSGRHVPGTWTAYIENEKVYIQFTGEDWDTGRSFLLSELGALPSGNEGTFKVTREAGTVTFKGIFTAGKGHGFYTFAESPTFKSYLEQKGYSGLNKQLMLDIFFTDINKSYFEFLKVNGYATISNEQLKDLAQQDLSRKVMEDYFSLFKTESWGHPSLNKIVELREHGVNARFVNSFRQMGYKENIPLDKALELRDHGVNPEFITSIQKMGYEKISLDKAVELKDHGVNPEFIYSMQKLGYKDVSLDRTQELIDHGVNTNFIKSIYALGFKDLTLDKAQELIDHGVTADFIKKMRDKGVKVYTLDEYIRLRDTGFNE